MIRARFKVKNKDDYRPVTWPIKYPFWCTGFDSDGLPILVAYAKNRVEIFDLWPDAEGVQCEHVYEIHFSERFPRPDWYKDLPNRESYDPDCKVCIECKDKFCPNVCEKLAKESVYNRWKM